MLNVGYAFSLAKNATNPRIGVLQIRRGVAAQSQHLVPTEHVIALPIRKQVGVLHCADADNASNLASLQFRQLWTLSRCDLERALLSFIQQIGQLNRLA